MQAAKRAGPKTGPSEHAKRIWRVGSRCVYTVAPAGLAFFPPIRRGFATGATPGEAGGGGRGALAGADATGAGAGLGEGTATGTVEEEMVSGFI